MWCLMPRQQVTSGFFRNQFLLALGLAAVTCLTAGHFLPIEAGATTPPAHERYLFSLELALGAVAYVGSVLWTLERRAAGGWCAAAILVGTLAILTATQCDHSDLSRSALRLGSSLSSAAVLGGAMSGMLLGHWYLTATTMSIAPLERLTWLFLAAMVLRLGMSTAGWFLFAGPPLGSLHVTWLVLRWLAGIVAPLVLGVMVLRILRYRNTQSATGVLFACVILTFIGEMSAALLVQDLGHPL